MESRAVDRVTAFTDAAVAIALTLLVLPLVDVAHEASGAAVTTLLREHGDDTLAFALSFFVVMAFWRGHRRLLEPVARLDETLLSLNILWLLGVVFLPVPTAVLTFEGDSQSAATILYLSNLLFVGLMGLGLNVWIAYHPSLLATGDTAMVRHHLRRGAVVCGTIAVVTVLAMPLGSGALPLLGALPAGQLVWQWVGRRRRPQVPAAHRS